MPDKRHAAELALLPQSKSQFEGVGIELCHNATHMANDDESTQWPAVIGRSLAFLCLAEADLRDKDLATQGKFLEALGLARKEAAALLGTSYASLSELYRQAKNKKGGKRVTASKTKRKR